jgi:hypothetical protein
VAERELEATAADFSTTVEPRPEWLRELRTSVRAWLEGAGVDKALRDSVILATHEVAATAVGKELKLEVEATLDDGVIRFFFRGGEWDSLSEEEGGLRSRFIHDLASEVEVQPERSTLALTFFLPE